MQQAGIGERMADNVNVKCLVGVNSISIKAIGYILSKPGLSVPKVAILCGGPDWPTSVLTGILKLPRSVLVEPGPGVYSLSSPLHILI